MLLRRRSQHIDKSEFRKAITALGFHAPRADVDAIFDQIDTDNSGAILYKELRKVRGLSRGIAIQSRAPPSTPVPTPSSCT